MRKRMLLVLVLLLLSAVGAAVATVVCDQPYVAAYHSGTYRTTSKVLVMANFLQTDSSEIGDNKWLAAVLSVAGAYGGTVPSAYTYQFAPVLNNTGIVHLECQVWYKSTLEKRYPVWDIGTDDWLAYYVKVYVKSDLIKWKCFAYENSYDLLADNPHVYTWTYDTGDGNLLAGIRNIGGFTIKFFQYGVESNDAITETAWRVLEDYGSYYDGNSWKYLSGYVCQGANSWITYDNQNPLPPYYVGGAPYLGANKEYSNADTVAWKYTGVTIPDGALLWDGSGTVSDIVAKPYSPFWE